MSQQPMRVEVVSSAPVPAEQVAAVTVALTALAADGSADHAGCPAASDEPGWVRAARLEGVGRPRMTSPADVELGAR